MPPREFSFVSVIIPTYRDTRRLRECLRALSLQTYPRASFEVVVVNNDPDEELDLGTEMLCNVTNLLRAAIRLVRRPEPRHRMLPRGHIGIHGFGLHSGKGLD